MKIRTTHMRLLSALLALVLLTGLLSSFPSLSFADEPGDEEVESENVALGKPVHTSKAPRNAAAITDGNPDSYWSTPWVPLYAEVDLQENYTLDRVVVKLPMKFSAVRSYAFAYNVYASVDGVNFDRIGEMYEPEKATENGFVFDVDSNNYYRVVRVMSTMSTAGSGASTIISEIEVYGEKSDAPVIETRTELSFPSYEEWLLENCGVDVNKIKDANGKYEIKDTYTEEDTLEALAGLVTRVLGEEYLSWFVFDVTDPLKVGKEYVDYYDITNDESGKIRISGNEGVSIAAGLNYYLKYFCKVCITQETRRVQMPKSIVPVTEPIHTECSVPVRYTYNYCTLSYTMPYYGFDDWQWELDYLMLSGVNVILDTTATEALWIMYLTQFGYTLDEAKQFVCGYTWKAWWLMGNLEGYGGPVSDAWVLDTVEMARINQRYMTVMGADPCLQAFVGTLPTDFAAHAGNFLQQMGYEPISPKMTGTGSWAGFTRPYALNTTYNGFTYLAKTFYETQNYIYGRIGDYYAGDFLHEVDGGFNLDKQFDKANMSRTVLDRLIDENNEAVWIIQSWWKNPLPEVVAGWGKDREKHILLLDLSAVQSPRWSDKGNYGGLEFGGSSWCYCILEDYGGREGAHGRLYAMVKAYANALADAKHLKGIGLTAEGTERNPVVFDLFWEMAWNPRIDAREWIKDYAERRYGSTEGVEPWTTLVSTLYRTATADGTTVNMAFCNYPKFDIAGSYFLGGYNRTSVNDAFRQLLDLYDLYKDEETYVYDVVEFFTTDLSNTATRLLALAFEAAKKADYQVFHIYKTKFLHAIALADELNGFVKNQLLGNWVGRVDNFVSDARTSVYCDFDIDLMKLDAVILITNWSTIDLGNYANRTYNGLLSDYYYEMWSLFMNAAETKIAAGTKITDGNSRAGITDATLYNVGRQVALDAMLIPDSFRSEPVSVDGDAFHRSLKDVLTEISTFYFYDAAFENSTAVLKDDAGVEISGGTLTGTVKGTKAEDIGSLFTVTGGGFVGVTDQGELLPFNAEVKPGMKLVILEEDGSRGKDLNVTIGLLTLDSEAAGEYEIMSTEVGLFVGEILSKNDLIEQFGSSVRMEVLSFLYAVDYAAYTESYAAYRFACDAMPEVKAALENAEKKLTEQKTADFASLKETFLLQVERYNALYAEYPDLAPEALAAYMSFLPIIYNNEPSAMATVLSADAVVNLKKASDAVRKGLNAYTVAAAKARDFLKNTPFAPAAFIVFAIVNTD